MSQIIPFEQYNVSTGAENEIAKRFLGINKDVAFMAAFPTLSIKGKVFAIVKDGVRKALTKTDTDGEVVPVQSISLNVLRANMKARVYFEEEYDDKSGAEAKPTCQSFDGIAPNADSEKPQSHKCAVCPHAVWGSKKPNKNSGDAEGKGTACSQVGRLAIAAPDKPSEPLLLRVPPASLKGFREAVKLGEQRKLPYNQLVIRIGFDAEAPSPKLTFKPVGVLPDAVYAKAAEMYDNEVVHQICGILTATEAPAQIAAPAKADPADELEAAIAAKEATERAKKTAAAVSEDELGGALGEDVAAAEAQIKAEAAAVKAKEEAAAKAKAAKAKAEANRAAAAAKAQAEQEAAAKQEAKPAVSSSDDLLGDLDGLLGGMDD